MRKSILAAACLLLCATAGAKTPKWLKSAQKSIFEIVAYDSDGQETGRSHGFFIDMDGTGISDRSVLVGAESAVTIDAAGIKRPVNIILAANDMYDFVRFSVTPDKKLNAVTLSPIQSMVDGAVSILPYKDLPVSATVSKSMSIDKDRYYYDLSVSFDQSYAGCPVFDEDGMVIGMVQQDGNANVTYALDARYVSDQDIQALSLDERAYTELIIRKSFPQDVSQALAYVFIKQSTASTKEYGAILEEFLLQFPDNADGMFNLGSYLILETDSTQYERGLELIERSIVTSEEKDRMHCDYASLIYNTTVQNQKTFDFWTLDKALEEVCTALSLKDEPAYYRLKGNILFAMKRYSEAYDCYMKLNGTRLASAETFLSAYTIRRQMDSDPEICIGLLDSTISRLGTPMPSSTASLLIDRAALKETAGLYREAVADYNTYESLIGTYSMTAVFYYQREQAEIKAKMYEQALADINRARQLEPDDDSLVLENASLLLRIGNYKAALPLLSELETEFKDNADIQRLLGVCYLRLDNKELARKHLTAAKDLGDSVAASLLEE